MHRYVLLAVLLAAFAAATVPMARHVPETAASQPWAYARHSALSDTVMVPYHDKRFLGPEDSIPVSIGITGCTAAGPFTYFEYRIMPLFRIIVVTTVHEEVHREQVNRSSSCAIALQVSRDPATRARHEAEAFCREIPAGIGVGLYANPDSGVAHTANLLSKAYPFGLSVDSAAAMIRRECDLTRYGART